MKTPKTNVLFVSTANAARSLLAEACLTHLGQEKFRAFSCGQPAMANGQPCEWALLALKTAAIPSAQLSCKPWTEFTRSGAPMMDFVITLDEATWCNHPRWPGQPESALWAYSPLVKSKKSPAAVGIATLHTLHSLRRRIELLVNLHAKLSKRSDLRHDLRDLAFM